MADDTLKKLGKVQSADQGRDAIHIAVLTMQAVADFHIYGKLWVDKAGALTVNEVPSNVGIVDPFLPPGTKVSKGDWYYVYLNPGSITGLVHVWTHPDFPERPMAAPPDAEAVIPYGVIVDRAKQRVDAFCRGSEMSLDYQEFIDLFENGHSGHYSFNGYYIYLGDEEISSEVPVAIIRDVETIIGRSVYERDEPLWFRCAC